MGVSGRPNMLAHGLLLACALTARSVALQYLPAFDSISPGEPPVVGRGQVYVALCTGDDSFQPWHQQADYCSSISSTSYPKAKDLVNGKGFWRVANRWTMQLGEPKEQYDVKMDKPNLTFGLKGGPLPPELVIAVASKYSRYTIVLVEMIVEADHSLGPVSLWLFQNAQLTSLSYSGFPSYDTHYERFVVATYGKFSYTLFRRDLENSLPYTPTAVCYNFVEAKQC